MILQSLMALATAIQLDGTAVTIKSIVPKISNARAQKLGTIIDKTSAKYDVKPDILVAIIAQESAFRQGAVNCRVKADYVKRISVVSCDLGVSQINFETWGKVLKLNPCRLRSDDAYGIDAAARILARVKRANPDDPIWWSKYHDSREIHRNKYENLVFSRLDKANIVLALVAE